MLQMKIDSTNFPKLRKIFHSLGLGCLGGSIFLQTIVFLDIFQRGYFLAVEQNMVILMGEIIMTFFTIFYFIFIIKEIMLKNQK